VKLGDLVRPIPPPREPDWVGVIIDFEIGEPVVYWSEEFNAEVEYREQLEVISESR
jgi:hypothetical protein